MAFEDRLYLNGIEIVFKTTTGSNEVSVSGVDYMGQKFYGSFDRKFISGGKLEVKRLAMICNEGYSLVAPLQGQFNNRPWGIKVKDELLEMLKIEVQNGISIKSV
jgi:hypothetical protein